MRANLVDYVPRSFRMVVGVIVCSIILLLSPFISLAVLSYEYLFSDAKKLGKTLLFYLCVWFIIMRDIWVGVFTKSLWFRGNSSEDNTSED